MTRIAPSLQAYFTQRMTIEANLSPNTLACYRDTFRLLVGFSARRCAKAPSDLDFADLDAPMVAAFLDHLESERGNTIRSRNVRLAAVHSFFAYASWNHPECAEEIARVLAIPAKRFEATVIGFLSPDEGEALLAAPNITNRTGRRDRAIMFLAIQTGLRISELIALNVGDLHLGHPAFVSCTGKGRKRRATPLGQSCTQVMASWLAERAGTADDVVFPNGRGGRLSRDAIERRIALHARSAAQACPSLATKRVTAHVLRHTAAMRLLEAGVDTTVIALWLGHEQVQTTMVYLRAHMATKERALERTRQPGVEPGRYHPPDPLLAFLEAL